MSLWPAHHIPVGKTVPEAESKTPGAPWLEVVSRCTVGRLGPKESRYKKGQRCTESQKRICSRVTSATRADGTKEAENQGDAQGQVSGAMEVHRKNTVGPGALNPFTPKKQKQKLELCGF